MKKIDEHSIGLCKHKIVLFDSLRYPIYTEHSTLEGTALAKRILNKGDE